ncbi:pectate lyase family protein [Pontibacter harenae]|uniref:pectate lyase family protein n=1 Tax=Pontibacter harenae TaxID=2894083 RepID=UPI001E31F7E6|nr:pectate lyase [Pontibacter harenae]MCC9168502.1 pectate lyase [Pontibacter harenae]
MIKSNIRQKVNSVSLVLLMACFAGCSQQPASVPTTEETATVATKQQPESGKPLAFPGAEGFGKHTTGGRGGQVVVVTNLNDDGPGSLREAIRKKGPRIIVFAVSGYINLESTLDINNPDITIAGQSAPGDGITLRYYPVNIKADNVIVRYMRFRMGDISGIQDDALGGNKGKHNIIVDHCSMGWATDESASFYRNTNFTLQWSIIAESLNQSVHEKGDHGYGGIWGGKGATFHHNLIASHMSRMPRFSGSKTTPNTPDELVDFRNNVIYNWGGNSVYGGEKGKYNMVNNYYKPGPATPDSKKDRLLEPYQPYGAFYIAGNVMEGNTEVSQNNKLGVSADHPDSAVVASEFKVEAVREQSAKEAYELVLAHAGASYRRDKVDERVLQYVRENNPSSGENKNGIIDSQEDVGGWPELKSAPAPEDKDQDGMPDEWERQHKLNPSSADDATAYTLDKQYTNIEVYLNGLVDRKEKL